MYGRFARGEPVTAQTRRKSLVRGGQGPSRRSPPAPQSPCRCRVRQPLASLAGDPQAAAGLRRPGPGSTRLLLLARLRRRSARRPLATLGRLASRRAAAADLLRVGHLQPRQRILQRRELLRSDPPLEDREQGPCAVDRVADLLEVALRRARLALAARRRAGWGPHSPRADVEQRDGGLGDHVDRRDPRKFGLVGGAELLFARRADRPRAGAFRAGVGCGARAFRAGVGCLSRILRITHTGTSWG